MTDQFYIRAQWAARRESVRDCAKRTQQLMIDLARCHPLLRQWNATADTVAEANKRQLTPTWQALEPFFTPFQSIEGVRPGDLGYTFWALNRQRSNVTGVILAIRCGRIDTSSGLFNSLQIDLPLMSLKVETLYQPEVLEGVMRAIVSAWAPDSVALLSAEYLHRYTFPELEHVPWPRPPGGPDVGWFTYLSANRLNKLSGTPPCEEIITLRDRGSFFIISREHLFSIDNPDDVARIKELKAYLKANHALEPLPEARPQRKKARAQKKSKPKAKPEPAAKPSRGETAARPKAPAGRKKA